MFCVVGGPMLVNMEAATEKAFHQTAKRFNVKMNPQLLERVKGKPIMEAYGILCANGDRESCERYHLDLIVGEKGLLQVADGVYSFLRMLVEQEYRRGVWISDPVLRQGLKKVNLLGYFQWACEFGPSFNIEELRAHLTFSNLKPEDVVYVGKDIPTIKALKQFGAMTVFVSPQEKAKLDGAEPDYTVSSLSDIVQMKLL